MARYLEDWVEGWLEWQAHSESPSLFTRWTAISLLASALSRKVFHEWEKRIYPNLFILLVAPPGEARKGSALSPAVDFLEEMEIPTAAESTTRESLIEQIEEAAQTIHDPESGEYYMFSALTIVSEEFGVFFQYKDERFIEDLCDWYDAKNRWRYKTKRSGYNYIRGMFINLIGATTPSTFRESLAENALAKGLLSRFILVYQERRGKVVVFPHKERRAQGQDLLLKLQHDFREVQALKGAFTFDRSFEALYERWYPNQADELPSLEDERIAGYASRRPTHLRKLAMILSASRDSSKRITAEDFERARELLIETEGFLGKLLGGLGKSPLASLIHNMLYYIAERTALGSPPTLQEIVGRFYREATRDEILQALATIEMMKKARRERDGNVLRYHYVQE